MVAMDTYQCLSPCRECLWGGSDVLPLVLALATPWWSIWGGGGCLLLVHTIAILPGDGVGGCFGYFTVHRIATLHKSVKGSLLCVFLGVR